MSDVQNTPNASPEAEQAISSLKKQADLLGISYKSNTSIATLQKAIKEKLEGPVGGEDSSEAEINTLSVSKPKGKSAEDYRNEALKLKRVLITCMDANKASNLEREMFCAGNSTIGTVKRVVEFGVPWHVESIILNSIKEKMYQAFTVRKNSRGIEITTSRLVQAYNVVELPALSEEEIDKLADRQIRTRALEDE